MILFTPRCFACTTPFLLGSIKVTLNPLLARPCEMKPFPPPMSNMLPSFLGGKALTTVVIHWLRCINQNELSSMEKQASLALSGYDTFSASELYHIPSEAWVRFELIDAISIILEYVVLVALIDVRAFTTGFEAPCEYDKNNNGDD